MVNRDKYNKVCGELDSALLREKQAEDLLKEQGEHLLNMGRQLESKHKDESSREISLAESARELCEVKLELSKKTHEIRGLSRKMEELQLEKSRSVSVLLEEKTKYARIEIFVNNKVTNK